MFSTLSSFLDLFPNELTEFLAPDLQRLKSPHNPVNQGRNLLLRGKHPRQESAVPEFFRTELY